MAKNKKKTPTDPDHELETRLTVALERAFAVLESGEDYSSEVPKQIETSARRLVRLDSPPSRGMILAIAAGTLVEPWTDPGSLQAGDAGLGVDRRGQAARLVAPLTAFRDLHGLTLKISQEPGVSNPWREPAIDADWLSRRGRLPSAEEFVTLVEWLREADGDERSQRAESLLDLLTYLIVSLASEGILQYPKFLASPRIAMTLVERFLESTPNRPDGLEGVVCAAVRTVASILPGELRVIRHDTNSPDPIDVLVVDDHTVPIYGAEVADAPLEVKKLRNEVVPAMLHHGLSRAGIVSRGPRPGDVESVNAYLFTIERQFGQRVDLLEVDDMRRWLSLPGFPPTVATRFLREIGDELDRYSGYETRHAWLDVLNEYVDVGLPGS